MNSPRHLKIDVNSKPKVKGDHINLILIKKSDAEKMIELNA